MSDKPEKETPGDGTVIMTDAPPSLRRDDKPKTPPAAPGTPAASDAEPADDEGDVTQVLPRNTPGRESTVALEVPPPSVTPPGERAAALPASSGPQTASRPPASSDATKAGAPPASPPIVTPPVVAAAAEPERPAQKAVPEKAPPSPPRPEPKAPPQREPSSAPPTSSSPAAPSSASKPVTRVDITDRTRIVSPRSATATTVNWERPPERPWITLEHVLPSDHAGMQQIDKEVVIIGRALECDVRLFSASASRQHARIEQRSDGWYLAPIEGKRVQVDGEALDRDVRLQPGMRLMFGDDELLVVDEEEPEPYAESRGIRWQVAVPVAVGAGAALLVLAWLLGMF